MLNKKFYKTHALHFFKDFYLILRQEIFKIQTCKFSNFENLTGRETCQRR